MKKMLRKTWKNGSSMLLRQWTQKPVLAEKEEILIQRAR